MPVTSRLIDAGGAAHPFRALFTAVRISSMVIWLSLFASPTLQVLMSAFPSAILTSVSSSSTVTGPSWLQSPTHAPAIGVDVGAGGKLRVVVANAVRVGLARVGVG